MIIIEWENYRIKINKQQCVVSQHTEKEDVCKIVANDLYVEFKQTNLVMFNFV